MPKLQFSVLLKRDARLVGLAVHGPVDNFVVASSKVPTTKLKCSTVTKTRKVEKVFRFAFSNYEFSF